MKKLYISLLSLSLLLIFFSCTGSAALNNGQLSAAEYFQKAYEATDKSDYSLAIRYYQEYQKNYPDDTEKNLWADFEIAFAYHKKGNEQKALELFDILLAKYTNDSENTLPPGPKVLAERVKTQIQKAKE